MKLYEIHDPEWDNDPIEDKNYINNLKQRMEGVDHEIELLKKEIYQDFDYWTGVGELKPNLDPQRVAHIKKKIMVLQTHRQTLNHKRLNALKNYKLFRHDTESAWRYASGVRKGPFPEGEDAIAKNGIYAMDYALDYLKKRFPKGEPAMRLQASPDKKDEYERRFGVNLNDYDYD